MIDHQAEFSFQTVAEADWMGPPLQVEFELSGPFGGEYQIRQRDLSVPGKDLDGHTVDQEAQRETGPGAKGRRDTGREAIAKAGVAGLGPIEEDLSSASIVADCRIGSVFGQNPPAQPVGPADFRGAHQFESLTIHCV